jgi:hypothetical protein
MNAELRDRLRRPQRSILLLAATSFALALSGLSAPFAQANTNNSSPIAGEFKASDLIITYKPGVLPFDSEGNPVGENLLSGIELKSMNSLGNNTFSFELEGELDAEKISEITRALEKSSQIELASPNLPISVSAPNLSANFLPTYRSTQNLTDSGLWGLDRIDQNEGTSPFDSQYIYDSTGQGVDAYVIDTGIYPHADFGGRLKPGFSSISDSRGTTDCDGHGTHVAGILGGATYGVAKEVNLIPVRALDCTGSGTDANIIAGINWIIANHQEGQPAVANMSLGRPTGPIASSNSALHAAVTNLLEDGVIVIVASGNGGSDACTQTPANIFGTITVNSLDVNDQDSSFSNFGACTDIYAPGRNIVSAGISSSTSSILDSGTSMATPFVAGAVARILQENPAFDRTQVVEKLFANAKPYNSGIAYDAPRMLQTPTVDDATLAANVAAQAAAAEAARIAAEQAAAAETARIAAEQAAALARDSAKKKGAEKAAAAAKKLAESVSLAKKSLNAKALTKSRISIKVQAPKGAKTFIQLKVGKTWKNVTVRNTTASTVIKVSRSGTYRVQIRISNVFVTSKPIEVK